MPNNNDDKNKDKNNKRKKSQTDIIPLPKKPRHYPIFYEIINIPDQKEYDDGGGNDVFDNEYNDFFDGEEEDNIIETEYLNEKLECIDDFIRIGNNYKEGKYDRKIFTKFNINVRILSKLVEPLENLVKMIGMDEIKKDIFELLLYQLQEFDNSKDMLHTIIDGEPGVGKTELAKILAKIYHKMGSVSYTHLTLPTTPYV